MKRTEPERIGTLIDRVMLEGDTKQTVLEQRACYLWPEVVGPVVNRHTFKRFVENGIMHVYLNSAPLKNELSFHRTHLTEAINKAVGHEIITEIQIH